MDAREHFGSIRFYPVGGGLLWLYLSQDPRMAYWSVEIAKAVVAYLQAWIAEQEARDGRL
jgi:hypothetical protein